MTRHTFSLVALHAALGCAHTTVISSTPPGAEVYVGESDEPAGRTPLAISATDKPIRVKQGDREVGLQIDAQLDWGIACANTGLACLASSAILAGIGGGLYVLGTGLGMAMPVIGPIIAVVGAPPACVGTVFWSALGGLACGAVTLPLQAWSTASVGPDRVEVDLEQRQVTSVPPARARLVELPRVPSDGAASSQPADGAAPQTQPGAPEMGPAGR